MGDEDTERLDWLSQHLYWLVAFCNKRETEAAWTGKLLNFNLREEIDKARATVK